MHVFKAEMQITIFEMKIFTRKMDTYGHLYVYIYIYIYECTCHSPINDMILITIPVKLMSRTKNTIRTKQDKQNDK